MAQVLKFMSIKSGIYIQKAKTLMVEKIFSRNIISALFVFVVGGYIVFTLFFTNKTITQEEQEQIEEEVLSSTALDFSLRDALLEKIEQALTIYPEEGWEETRRLLEEVKRHCKRGNCDPEIFFNESLDSLAKTLTNNKEFTYAASTLGLLYSSSWELADVDGDQENEVVALQRDALNLNYIILKVIDFQEDLRVTDYKLEGVGYFSSPNSSGGHLNPIKILDITGESVPEIILFLSPGRGGADMYVFQYAPPHLNLRLRKDDLLYPEFTFSDIDNDRRLEIIAEGYNSETKTNVKEVIE